jgi:formylglycine-generating enzyme required for sulfatase activity
MRLPLVPDVSVSVARSLFASAVVALLAGCADKSEIAPEPGSGGSGGGAASGGSGGAKPVACPAGTAGAQQLLIQTDTGAAYCIDQREVTRGEYKAFLDAKAGDVSGQPPGCAWNERYAPLIPDPADPEGAFTCPTDSWALETYPAYPVVCMDICDAMAYCTWAGKRLCGVMGAGSADLNKVVDHETVAWSKASEWAYACSQGGKTTYPYGDTYEPARCIDKSRIDADGLTARAAKTGTQETCHGTEPPFDQIFHMSGSVQEWINVCHPTLGAASCAVGGGAVGQPPEQLSCTGAATTATDDDGPGDGFRCCANVAPAAE